MGSRSLSERPYGASGNSDLPASPDGDRLRASQRPPLLPPTLVLPLVGMLRVVAETIAPVGRVERPGHVLPAPTRRPHVGS